MGLIGVNNSQTPFLRNRFPLQRLMLHRTKAMNKMRWQSKKR